MSVVYFSLVLFVRIEQNVKIYNTLHLVFFTGYTLCHIKYSQGDIIFLLPRKYLPVCLWCYHTDCVTPQTFSITIVNKHISP